MQCDGNLAGRNLIRPNGHVSRRPPQRLVTEGDGAAGTRGNSGKPPNEPQARDGGSRRRHDRIGQVQSHHRRRIRHASKGSQRGQTRFGSFLVVVLPPRFGSLEPLRLLSVSRFRDLAPDADSRFGRSRSRRAVACGVLIARSSHWPHASVVSIPCSPTITP